MENCLFCNWKDEKEKVVLENEYAFARFDEFPVSMGILAMSIFIFFALMNWHPVGCQFNFHKTILIN